MDIATEVLWNKHATVLLIQKAVSNGKTLIFLLVLISTAYQLETSQASVHVIIHCLGI